MLHKDHFQIHINEEEQKINELLSGRIIENCSRNKEGELLIKSQRGTKFFIDGKDKLDFSIIGYL